MEEASLVNQGEDDLMDLPPGFRFHPTDEEIISYYLTEKVMNCSFSARAVGEVDLNKSEPWDLPKKAKMGEKEWYFFCQRDRKYPTGMRTNRATESGYWKATGKDKEIYKEKGCLVGMKKTLVFYRGRAPKGEKTNWVMHEYRLEGKFSYYNLPKAAKDEWVVCRVFHKNTGIKRSSIPNCSTLTALINPTEDEVKASSTRFSDGNHHHHRPFFSSALNGYQLQTPTALNYQAAISNHTPNSIFYPQAPLLPFQPSRSHGYLNCQMVNSVPSFKGQTSGQCKVEQFSSNQSMVSLSQETGLSTDMNNTEISSVFSKHRDIGNNGSYEDLEAPPSVGQIGDFDYLLNY